MSGGAESPIKGSIPKDHLIALGPQLFPLEQKINFLLELECSGHSDEALLLSCCYIDALAQVLYHNAGTGERFARVLIEHSGNESFGLIDPQGLCNQLIGAGMAELAEGIQSRLPLANNRGEGDYWHNMREVLELTKTFLSPPQLEKLKREAWRGSIAHLVYKEIRNTQVHSIVKSIGLSFPSGTHKGKPILEVRFPVLLSALRRIFQELKELCATAGAYVGR